MFMVKVDINSGTHEEIKNYRHPTPPDFPTSFHLRFLSSAATAHTAAPPPPLPCTHHPFPSLSSSFLHEVKSPTTESDFSSLKSNSKWDYKRWGKNGRGGRSATSMAVAKLSPSKLASPTYGAPFADVFPIFAGSHCNRTVQIKPV